MFEPTRLSRRRNSRSTLATMAACLTMAIPIGLVGGLVGCDNKTSDGDITWVEPEDATAAMLRRGAFGQSRGESLWLDPRTPEAFARGHIPGAVNIPFRDLETVYPTIRDRGTIVVYGESFDDTIARAASKRLIELRHSRVLTLRGGLEGWERAGNPIATGAATGE